MLAYLLAAGVAGTVTYLEMDQIFTIPDRSPGRWVIRRAMAVFVLLNAGLAIALYALLTEAGFLDSINPVLRGLLVGAGYLSLVRLKFATVEEIPFGFEYFYNLAKRSAYARINRRVIDARDKANSELVETTPFDELVIRATSRSTLDMLASDEERDEAKDWVLRVINDDRTQEIEKKLVLADFILSGSRAGHS
ncbi:MAG TPA: hypothetical protein VF176_03245 [Solirubrobacterales bacterium]